MKTKVSQDAQRTEVKSQLNTELVPGNLWYIIDLKWWQKWKNFVNFDESLENHTNGWNEDDEPGPIDNSALLDPTTKQVRANAMLEIDLDVIPKTTWDYLKDLYGTVHEHTDKFKRSVEKLPNGQCRVEIHPIQLQVGCYVSPPSSQLVPLSVSRSLTLGDLKEILKERFLVDAHKETRLLRRKGAGELKLLMLPEETLLEDSQFNENDEILIEERKSGTGWMFDKSSSATVCSIKPASSLPLITNGTATTPIKGNEEKGTPTKLLNSNGKRDSSPQSSSGSGGSQTLGAQSQQMHRSASPSPSYTSGTVAYSRSRHVQGVCGLTNLGNTCFMNSALQCMSNVYLLTEYFLSEQWKEDLNVNNPLGMKGEIAASYARLIRQMWSGQNSCETPREFKIAVGHFAPQFCGFSQHDSQELLMFLLDGLHEDLNRIKTKPYVATKDSDDRPDEEVAREAWSYHTLRNDSVIIDLFHGQLKSRVDCPDCSRVSVTFDPYASLSLPLPTNVDYNQTILYMDNAVGPSGKPNPILRMTLSVPKTGTFHDLLLALQEMVNVPPEECKVVEVYDNKFYKTFNPHDQLRSIMARDVIYVYHIPELSQEKCTLSRVVYTYKEKHFHIPFFLPIVGETFTYDYLVEYVLRQMARYFHLPGVRFEGNTGRLILETDDAEPPTVPASGGSNSTILDHCETSEVEQPMEMEGKENHTAPPPYPGTEETASAMDTDATPISSKEAVVNVQEYFDLLVTLNGATVTLPPTKQVYRVADIRPHTLQLEWKPEAKARFLQGQLQDIVQDHPSVSSRANSAARSNSVQLSECLKLFTRPERLGKDDMWYCSKCKEHKAAMKKFDLWSLPRVLVIHLKRFQYSRYHRDKVDTRVEFPLTGLDMSEWVTNPSQKRNCVYDLVSVSNHMGGLGGGHYTAFGKNARTNTWYKFDDSFTSAVSEEDVVTRNAYVLVYQRREEQDDMMQLD